MAMNEINTLKDLHIGGHLSRAEVTNIAKSLFDGKTEMAGPDGYVITACDYDKLPEHIQGFIFKAILDFKATNILDKEDDDYIGDVTREELDKIARDFADDIPYSEDV